MNEHEHGTSTRVYRSTTTYLALTTLLIATAGCHSKTAATPENFIAALNAHFVEHPECLFPEAPRFPYETTDPVKTKQMNTLVASKLLTVVVERDISASRYTPTQMGERAAPRFCYGHRLITSIDSFTPPAQANGFLETQVVYHYTMEEVPVWAKPADVQAAFPTMAHDASGTATGKATLARSAVDWQVPD
jgi:hypothetical protein